MVAYSLQLIISACLNQSLASYGSQVYLQLALKHQSEPAEISSGEINSNLEMWFKPVLDRLVNSNSTQARLLLDVSLFDLASSKIVCV